FRVGGTLVRYLTNVTDPQRLSMREIARLYARRWDVELAFKTLKGEVGLQLLWSSKPVVLLIQVWAGLIIAQILQALRMEVAFRANVDPFEVSLPLFIEYLPHFAARGLDGLSECVKQGRTLGIIRPSTRLRVQAPEVSADQLRPLPPHLKLPLRRSPYYPQEEEETATAQGAAVRLPLPPPEPVTLTQTVSTLFQAVGHTSRPPPSPLVAPEPITYTLRQRRGVLVRIPMPVEREVR